MIPTLEDAVRLAVEAHRGGRYKSGQMCISHPRRVMPSLPACVVHSQLVPQNPNDKPAGGLLERLRKSSAD